MGSPALAVSASVFYPDVAYEGVIDSVLVKNLRSLESLPLKLRPLNVFVGPNGAGKSNILSAFHLLQEYATTGQQVISGLGNDSSFFWGGGVRGHETISIELEGQIVDPAGRERSYSYSWQVTRHPQGFVQLSGEKFAYVNSGQEQVLLKFPAEGGAAQLSGEDGRVRMGLGPGGQSFLSIAAQQFEDSGLKTFAKQLMDWEFIGAAPSYARQPQKVERELRLTSGGENLSAVLHSIYAEDHEAFARITDALEAAVPELKSVSTPITKEGTTYIAATERGLDMKLPVWALSDGTIALLTLFTVLEKRDRPGLIGIEEPENFIHPGVLENLVESIHRAAETSQVFVSTHSPYLVNLLKPEDLVIVEKTEGRTHARRAEGNQGIKEATEKLGLGEVWVSGGLGGVP